MNTKLDIQENIRIYPQSLQIDHVLTVADVQQILKISRAMSYELVNSGVFPVLRIGKTIRIPAKPFEKWLYSNDPAVQLRKSQDRRLE